jgi:hypothetical protein
LGYLLQNRMYVGELNHRGQSYPGEHPPIIARELFDAVQAELVANRATAHHRQAASEALLMGRIFDDRGNRMTPTHSRKNGARYRYYTSRARADGRKDETGSVASVPAPDVEALVLHAVCPLSFASRDFSCPPDHGDGSTAIHRPKTPVDAPSDGISSSLQRSAHGLITAVVDRVVIMPKSIDVYLNESIAVDRPEKVISIAWIKPTSHRQRAILAPQDVETEDRRVIRTDARTNLIEAIARARRWMDEISSGEVDRVEAVAVREGRSSRSIRMTLSLAFLAPNIVQAAMDGTIPRGIGLSRLVDMPTDWDEQAALLGQA